MIEHNNITCVLIVRQEAILSLPSNLEFALQAFIINGLINQLQIFDGLMQEINYDNYKAFIKKNCEDFKNGLPVFLNIHKEDMSMVITLQWDMSERVDLIATPQKQDRKDFNLAPYVLMVIQICENFAIESLRSTSE